MQFDCERSRLEKEKLRKKRIEEGTEDTGAYPYSDGQLLEKVGEGDRLALVKRMGRTKTRIGAAICNFRCQE